MSEPPKHDGKASLLDVGRLTIDLSALTSNWKALNKIASSAECAACVKADAYGISLENVVDALWSVGCKTFFVATPSEGLQIRAMAPDATIYILDGLLPGTAKAYGQASLRPVLNSLAEVDEWSERHASFPAALHIDTGMNRLGLSVEDLQSSPVDDSLMQNLNLSLIMTHLACGDMPASSMNHHQLSRFADLCTRHFPGIKRSLANSAGIFNGDKFHLDMVRPGIALYGGAALKAHRRYNPMKPVVMAEARILQIRTVKEGESVGYGGTQVVEHDCRIAIVSAGYADGYIRLAGSTTATKGAHACVDGIKVPLVGRVSMDMLAIDVTDVEKVERGDYVELFGPNVSVTDVATAARTIDYEFLTGLGPRYTRIYKDVQWQK